MTAHEQVGVRLTEGERRDLIRSWPWPQEAATTTTGFVDTIAAVERIVADRLAAVQMPEATERVEWGVRQHGGRQHAMYDEEQARSHARRSPGRSLIRRTVTEYAPRVGEWEIVQEDDR